jgi:hypothetical protein
MARKFNEPSTIGRQGEGEMGLTEDDGKIVKGKRDQLIGSIQEGNGIAREKADTDLHQGRVLSTGRGATIAAFAAAGFVVATGGVVAATVAAGVPAAGGIGYASTVFGRQLADDQTLFPDTQLARRGVLLWVRISDPARERPLS